MSVWLVVNAGFGPGGGLAGTATGGRIVVGGDDPLRPRPDLDPATGRGGEHGDAVAGDDRVLHLLGDLLGGRRRRPARRSHRPVARCR